MPAPWTTVELRFARLDTVGAADPKLAITVKPTSQAIIHVPTGKVCLPGHGKSVPIVSGAGAILGPACDDPDLDGGPDPWALEVTEWSDNERRTYLIYPTLADAAGGLDVTGPAGEAQPGIVVPPVTSADLAAETQARVDADDVLADDIATVVGNVSALAVQVGEIDDELDGKADADDVAASFVALTTAKRTTAIRDGNVLSVLHSSFHPSNRPLVEIFDGTSHPLSAYFADLAAAQAFYPHAGALSDESDWAALQAAQNAITSHPRGFGLLASDWDQYGTAIIEVPVDSHAVVNRPITATANANKNALWRSAAPWGARIRYTGVDGGRIFDFAKDGVGSVVGVENLVLQGGGIRCSGPLRGDLRFGDGCLMVDTPHPAVLFADTVSPPGVGVVFPRVFGMHTHNCAGGVWAMSSTADLTSIEHCRFISSTDVPIKINTVDITVDDCDFQGITQTAAEAGVPYIQICDETGKGCSDVKIGQVRFGSETFVANGITFKPPREYVVCGPLTGVSADQLSHITIRSIFRTASPTSVSARAAILLNCRVSNLVVDGALFEPFNDCLVDEAYMATQGTAQSSESIWGANAVSNAHAGPIFSGGAAGWVASAGTDPMWLDRNARAVPLDAPNLWAASQDMTAWSLSSTTVAQDITGPSGIKAFTVTKTAANGRIYKTITAPTGRPLTIGILAKAGTIGCFDIRVQQGLVRLNVDQQTLRLGPEWVLYTVRCPFVAASTTVTVSMYVDRADVGTVGTVAMCMPFAHEGLTPTPPRLNTVYYPRTQAPSPLTVGEYAADGVSWDPLTRAKSLPYRVFYDGTQWCPVSADPTSVDGPWSNVTGYDGKFAPVSGNVPQKRLSGGYCDLSGAFTVTGGAAATDIVGTGLPLPFGGVVRRMDAAHAGGSIQLTLSISAAGALTIAVVNATVTTIYLDQIRYRVT